MTKGTDIIIEKEDLVNRKREMSLINGTVLTQCEERRDQKIKRLKKNL